MNHPNPPFADELLSAYLDDELDPNDKAKVVAAIEGDERLRALVADLRQIRADIQALPSHSLSPAFAESVTKAFETQAGGAVVLKSDINPHRNLRWIAGLAATAAVIMIALWAIGPGKRGNSTAVRSVADSDSPGSAAVANSASELARAVEAQAVDAVDMDALSPQPAAIAPTGPPKLPAIASASAEALEGNALEELPAGVRPFDWSLQKDTVDAIVAVTLPVDRLAQVMRSNKSPQFSGPAPLEREQVESSEHRLYAYYQVQGLEEDFRDFGIENDINVLVLEGTSAQIADGMKSLEATATNTLLLKGAELAASVGLPPVGRGLARAKASGDLSDTKAVAELPVRPSEKSAPQPLEQLADAADATAPRLRSTLSASAPLPPTPMQNRQESSPRRYRILLLVNPQ